MFSISYKPLYKIIKRMSLKSKPLKFHWINLLSQLNFISPLDEHTPCLGLSGTVEIDIIDSLEIAW